MKHKQPNTLKKFRGGLYPYHASNGVLFFTAFWEACCEEKLLYLPPQPKIASVSFSSGAWILSFPVYICFFSH